MDMITLLEKYMGKQAVKRFLPMQPGDVYATYADISKAARDLNFEPRVRLVDGLKLFSDWFRTFRK